MLYLLDANVLIDANRDYYPIQRVPEFWEWLIHMGERNQVKIPSEIHDEIKGGRDDLAAWSRRRETMDALILQKEVQPLLVQKVLSKGYAADLKDDEIDMLGRDPFLITYGLMLAGKCTIVTTEVSKPSKKRANRHIPDVCNDLRIPCCNSFDFLKKLDFSTNRNNWPL